MLREEYDSVDYLSLLQKIGNDLSIPLDNNVLLLPRRLGSGYIMAYNSPDGYSILLKDCSFNEGMVTRRHGNETVKTFVFSVNETMEEEKNFSRQKLEDVSFFLLKNNAAHFFGAWLDSGFYFPPGVRVKCINIMLENDYLKGVFGANTYEKFSSYYYTHSKLSQPEDIMDAGYRNILDEITALNFDHPFRLHFIHNRIMLMLEKFVSRSFEKLNADGSKIKLKDDEIRRLIMVESLLVKDYAKTAPTISELSRVAAMSPTKLKADFKVLYGMPIYEYYQKHRMLFAKNLLQQKEFPVKEVGRMVGYSNLGHFAASFKKAFGILPKSLNASEGKPLLNQDEKEFSDPR